MKHTSAQPRTQWVILRYTYPDHGYNIQDMWSYTGIPDDLHTIWAEDLHLIVMELWYGGGRHRSRTLQELLELFHVYDS